MVLCCFFVFRSVFCLLFVFSYLFFFFFSSRRRHTRFDCDWSSDVCSSDLEGRNPVTVVRDLYTLSSVLRRAVKAGELRENPVRRVDKPRVDRRGKVRFLDQAEETRLRQALKARDEEMRNRRTFANNRRETRHEWTRPPLTHFGDHLTPAVLLSM